MTATLTDTRPGPAARPRTASPTIAAGRPRLLLPPLTDPKRRAARAAPAPLASVRSVLSPVTAGAWPTTARPEPPHAPSLADPTPLCGAVVVAAIEALRCSRPLAQLARWVSPEVYEALARAVSPAPLTPGRRAVVRRVRVCLVGPGVAEGTVVVHDGARVRAAAVRFEAHRGSWRATVLQIG